MSAGATSKKYPTSIVGERSYQPAIFKCVAGQPVTLLRERDNPYDDLAIVVVCERRATIGYIARDSWLRDAIHDDAKGCRATIKSIDTGEAGVLGVVLDVELCTEPLGSRKFKR